MRRHPTEAEGQVALNMSQAARFIARKCGGKSPCPRVLQRHCHADRLDYFQLPKARAFFTTEAWVEAYLDTCAPSSSPPSQSPTSEAKRRAARALDERQARHGVRAPKGGGTR